MRRTVAAAGFLALLAGGLPAWGQQWVGERLCAGVLPQGGEFGSAVAIGDDGTIAVGDYRNNVVYLFDRGSCERSDTIQSPDGDAWFGFSLAIFGNELLVGAPKHGGTGAAYLVVVENGHRMGELRLVAVPGSRPGDEVGSSVAMDGDLLAIGARGAGDRRGRVYAGSRENLTVVPAHRDLAQRAELGQSVALSGTTLVMGAPSPFRGSRSLGAAYVARVGSPEEPILLLPGQLEDEAAFGYAVAVAGERILVGAPLADRNGMDSGAVFDFRRGNGGWEATPQPLRTGGRGDQLGVAVALNGGTAMIGARYADGTRGAAYLVGVSGDSQSLRPREPVPAGVQLGFSVAIRGGIAVAGAFREARTGAAYLFQHQFVPAVELVVAGQVEEADTVLPVTLHTVDRNPVPRDFTFRITAEDGTARFADGDYSRLAENITLPAGAREAQRVFSMSFQDDHCENKEETFRVALSDLSGSPIDAATVKILDDDKGGLELTPDPLQTSEDGTPVPLTVHLTCPPSKAVTVSFEATPPLARFSPAQPEFTSQDLQMTVSGVDNTACGPELVHYRIVATTTSQDSRLDGLTDFISAINTDDERACLSVVSKAVCTDPYGTVVYTISFTNSLPGAPDAPAELDILPPEVSVVTASADRGTAVADPIDNSVRWTGLVPAGEVVTITIVAALDELPGPELASHQADLTYDRDGRGHLETIPIVFSTEEVGSCPP